MTFKKIIFFNQFHNGDCFVNKTYVDEIVRILEESNPALEFVYAHNNHPDIIKDIQNVTFVKCDQIKQVDRMMRIGQSQEGDILYINTWVGCWQGQMFPFGQHSNFKVIHNIWREYFTYLDIKKYFVEDQDYYLPSINFNKFDIDMAKAFLYQHLNKKFVLFCNGSANSGQSDMGDLKHSIGHVAAKYPDWDIVCTAPTSLTAPNIIYTKDIFGLENDLNQIAYISNKAQLIIGKNSGPFSYSQHKDNLLDPNVKFLNFSKLATDCPSGGSMYPARCYFSNVTDPNRATEIIFKILEQPNLYGTEHII